MNNLDATKIIDSSRIENKTLDKHVVSLSWPHPNRHTHNYLLSRCTWVGSSAKSVSRIQRGGLFLISKAT